MTDPIDTLRRLRPGPFEPPPAVTFRAREALVQVMEGAASPTVSVSESGSGHDNRRAQQRIMNRRRHIGVMFASVAAVILIAGAVVLIPTNKSATVASAALARVAATAALRPSQLPGADQDYFIQEQVSIRETVHDPTDNSSAQATFVGTEKAWISPDGSVTFTQDWGLPIFSSPAEKANWDVLPDSNYDIGPESGSIEESFSCQSGGAGLMNRYGFFDVSDLPTQEAQLAADIEDGTTGVQRVDAISAGANTDFERVAMLLAGPDIGMTPQFTSALYDVLSTLPGVTLVGTTTSDSGHSGLEFAAPDTNDIPMTVIVDPDSGAFLELRYGDDNGPSPIGLFGGPVPLEFTTTTQWVQPLQNSVVSASTVPAVSGPTPTSPSLCAIIAAAESAAAAASRNSGAESK